MNRKLRKACRGLTDVDRELARQLFQNYSRALSDYIRKKVSADEDADDCLSDVYVRVIRNIDKFRDKPDEDHARLLYAITNSVITDKFRQDTFRRTTSFSQMDIEYDDDGKRINYEDTIADGTDVQSLIVSKDTQRELKLLLQRMESPDKDIIVLKFVDEKTTEEISEILNMNPSTVRTRLERTLKRMRKELTK